ncbi:MAG TPA: hypothetical protein VN255_16145, partial [Mycobacterium sp.]|nr:hypothetical protein [Mycobacterium sp.]
MNTRARRLLSGIAIAAVLLLGQGAFVRAAGPSATPFASSVATPASGPTGNEMLSVQPSLLSLTAKAGATTTAQLTIRAAANLSLTIKAQGLGQGIDGNFTTLNPDQDASPYSARAMLSVSPDSLTVKPGDTVKLTVSVAVPANVGDGSRYAILSITGFPPSPSGSSNVGFGVELGVSTIIQIANTTQTKTGSIDGIDVAKALPGQALPVTVSFKNTGNSHFGATPDELVASAVLLDSTGAQLASATADGNNLSVLPSFVRDMPMSMTPSKALVDGSKYHIEVGVGLKDGTVFDRKALDFTWSGGGVISSTPAPLQTPPVSSPTPTSDTG